MFERLKKYDKKAIGQFIRFGIVGIINTLITLIVIYFLQEILHVKYTISNFIGYRDIICTRFLGSTFEYDRIYTV